MAPLFPRASNTLARASVLALLSLPVLGVLFLLVWVRTSFVTGQRVPIEQPVQFDHRHHVADLGIDCRYCHDTVEVSSTAGMPATETCMSCHLQIWNQSPRLEPVRRAYFEGRSIEWNRVHNLPDFVYFDHSIHVAKGVGCVTCHGRVDQMPLVEQWAPLTMSWCLDCHREPAPYLRPRAQVLSMTWSATDDDRPSVATALREIKDVHARTSCTTCHR